MFRPAFTVDVEEWFQVGAYETALNRHGWDRLESRVALQVDRVLSLLADARVKATFFCLGWVAGHTPDVIRMIADSGHEIACHGLDHARVHTLTPDQFAEDIARSKKSLEDVSGCAVTGYRAPSFSLTDETAWAHRILAETGFLYSSSIYPVKTDHYGQNTASRRPYRPVKDHDLIELPLTALELFGRRWPVAGGGYFRLLPKPFGRWAFGAGTRQSGAGIFYMHPWELDPDQPDVADAPVLSRFRHRVGLSRMAGQVADLLRQHQWQTMSSLRDEAVRSLAEAA